MKRKLFAGFLVTMTASMSPTIGALTPALSAQSKASDSAMTGADLQQICTDPSADGKAACRFYVLGITQGISLGISIADGKTKGGRPCIPDNTPADTLELAVKMKLGQDLMVYPEDKKLAASGLIGAVLINAFPCRKPR